MKKPIIKRIIAIIASVIGLEIALFVWTYCPNLSDFIEANLTILTIGSFIVLMISLMQFAIEWEIE